MRRPTLRRTAAGLAALLLTGSAAGCSSEPAAEDTVKAFLAGWRGGKLDDVGFVTAAGARIAAPDVLAQLKTISGDLGKQPPAAAVEGEATVSGDTATTPVTFDWTLPGGAHWAYTHAVRTTKAGSDGWRVIWEPATLHADLREGDKLRVRRVAARRGGVLDAAGKPLITEQPVMVIGVSPERITDLAGLKRKLVPLLARAGAPDDLKTLDKRVADAAPDAFVDIVTLRMPAYRSIQAQFEPLKGTVWREEKRSLAPTRAFARALLGTVDAATREDIDARPDVLTIGDQAGHGGLQQKYDTELRGTPGVAVVIAREAADDSVEDTPLFQADPVAGKSVKVSLDSAVQNAADAALAAEKQPSSMVAVRVSDSSVLAVANGPDPGGVNTALTGQVAPGSTFKMVSAYGLLARKVVTARTVVDCPKTLAVDGATFKNSHDQALGKVTFNVDFAKSCNTAFAALAPRLTADGLREAATALGVGGNWTIGVDAYTGKVSDGATPAELAAATFGQGTTSVSPLAMAVATAAVARGEFQAPKLVLDPAPPAAAAPTALDAESVAALRAMMREVVTKGTGTGLRAVPGGPVYGKTGTAEFQTGSDETHAWFVGYQGDVAFAVMVQRGGAGSEAAVPIVKRFLTGLR